MQKEEKFRDELENITKQIKKLEHNRDKLQLQIDLIDEIEENARMKDLCSQKWIIIGQIDSLEKRRNHLINLLNVIPR